MSPTRSRLCVAIGFAVLVGLALWRWPAPVTEAALQADPNLVWSIGAADNSADEFVPGAEPALTYVVGQSEPGKHWRERQNASDDKPPVYTVRFALSEVPAAAELALDMFFLGPSPAATVITVHGKRGIFRIQPAGGQNLDERQANNITYSRQALRVPLDASLLKRGENEIGIAFRGSSGSVYYDSLALRKGAGAGLDLSASVEPTIFYRRAGEQLKEVTEVVLRHRRPMGKAAVSLKLGAAVVKGEAGGESYDFGERVIELEAPAVPAPQPYELEVTADGQTSRFHGEFHPEKRWRIFAGFKIHNDIGFTDLQPHVEELDNRNTDGALDIIARFPFYKFNLETTWLVENYLASRRATRIQQLVAMATANRVGINALYLNLMTGLCTGEELYRSLYYANSLRKKYGLPLKFACLTDAPSHSWFVPALLADVKVPGFAIGSNQTRAPLLQNGNLNEESPFWWEAIDGRRVMAWFARSYLQFNRLAGNNPTVDHLKRTVSQFLARYRRGGYPVDAVLLYGLYTDNASIRDGDTEILRAWRAAYEYPKILPATDSDYYDYLAKNFAGKLPKFRGDGGAYWEDGVGSTARETAINRDSQRLLPVAEMAAALSTAFHPLEAYPAGDFRAAWKNLLFYDEHTWGASNAISQPDRRGVHEQWEFKRAYAWRAHWAAMNLFYRSMNRLAQNVSVDGPTLFVFNPDLWPRTDVVEIELNGNQQLFDAAGAAVAVEAVRQQQGYRVVRFLAREVPGLGYRAYPVRRADGKPAGAGAAGASSWQIESRYYRVALDPATGAIAQLVDKELGRDLADSSAPYKLNELLYVSGGENSRILYDRVNVKPAQLDIAGQRGARLVENGGRRIAVRSSARNVPEIETEVKVYDDIKRIDIVNRIRKDEVRSKEAVYFAFPFRVSPPELAYQVQNSFVRPNADQLPGAGREWFTPQNLVVARDPGITIAWATPDAPLVTLTGINRGLWPKHLEIRNGHVFSYVMNNYWFTNYRASQGGEFTFRYSITSRKDFDEAALARFDAETRSPLVAYNYYDTGNVRLEPVKRSMPAGAGAFFRIDAAHAQVTAFKEAEDRNGFILRLRETAGRKGVARLESPVFPLAAAQLTNGVEDNLSALPVANGAVDIPLQPRGFTTVRLVFGSKEVRP